MSSDAETPNPAARPQPTPPRLELPASLEAIYANVVRITHSPSEMIFDFAQMLPDRPAGSVKARLLMSPLGAKLFQKALADNIARYESIYGEIPTPGENSLASQLFRPKGPPNQEP